ncbi:MAG: cytochrome c oxidase assembly protein [Rubripirellula sp.]
MSDMIRDPAMWNLASPIWLVAILVLLAYGYGVGWKPTRRAAWLVTGLGVLVFAFVSPVGVLANGYLFSAHMIQHLLLLLVVPLCLVQSLPQSTAERLLQLPKLGAALRRLLKEPVLGWCLGLGAMWFWHVPSLCNAATQHEALGLVRSVSFLVAGTAFWWAIYGPIERQRLEPPTAVVYLFSACLGCTLLGIYITFTTVSVCPAFADPAERLMLVTKLFDAGFTPSVDQQVGGLLMWVPPCSLYVCAIIGVLCRWYSDTSNMSFPQADSTGSDLVEVSQ